MPASANHCLQQFPKKAKGFLPCPDHTEGAGICNIKHKDILDQFSAFIRGM